MRESHLSFKIQSEPQFDDKEVLTADLSSGSYPDRVVYIVRRPGHLSDHHIEPLS